MITSINNKGTQGNNGFGEDALRVFEFKGDHGHKKAVRTMVNRQGELLFVGKDVAEALGYKNPLKALRDHVDAEDKGGTKCSTLGGTQSMIVINESGLYSLILSSHLPSARRFKRWVTSEVLPALRRTGRYQVSDRHAEELAEAMLLIGEQRTELEEQQAELTELQMQVDELRPSADFVAQVLLSPATYTTTQVAKNLGYTAAELHQELHQLGIIYPQSGQWHLYAPYMREGLGRYRTYFDHTGRPFTRQALVWTERGKQFIWDILKK